MTRNRWIASMAAMCALAALTLLLVACGGEGTAPRGGKVVLKVASVLPPEHPASQALIFMRDRVAELSEGGMEIRLFMSGQLGDATESVENCQRGNTEMVFVSIAPLTQFVPELNALSLPYIFRDKKHEYAVVDGPLGEQLTDKLGAVNLKALSFFDAGSRNLMTKRGPIETPEDLRGMKIRVMSSRVMIDTINAMGASAVAMGQGEVYGALQTGVIDGWENNPPTCLAYKMHETGCTHFTWTRHLAIPDIVLINKAVYDRLTTEQQALLETVSRETVVKQRELWNASEAEAIRELESKGMTFADVDTQPFFERTESVREDAYQRYGEDFRRICLEIINHE